MQKRRAEKISCVLAFSLFAALFFFQIGGNNCCLKIRPLMHQCLLNFTLFFPQIIAIFHYMIPLFHLILAFFKPFFLLFYLFNQIIALIHSFFLIFHLISAFFWKKSLAKFVFQDTAQNAQPKKFFFSSLKNSPICCSWSAKLNFWFFPSPSSSSSFSGSLVQLYNTALGGLTFRPFLLR